MISRVSSDFEKVEERNGDDKSEDRVGLRVVRPGFSAAAMRLSAGQDLTLSHAVPGYAF